MTVTQDKFEKLLITTRSYLLEVLIANEENNKHGYWSDGQEILCKTEDAAERLADFLEDCGFAEINTGYYDPEQDKVEGCVDEYTGFWYVSM